jgi:hypothetical protein
MVWEELVCGLMWGGWFELAKLEEVRTEVGLEQRVK